MHKNVLWLAFLSFFTLVTLGYTVYTATQVYSYQRLNQMTTATVSAWGVHQIGSDKFVISGTYRFLAGDQVYSGSGQFHWPVYRSRLAAQAEIPAKSTHTIWYRPSDPTISALERVFPLRSCIYTGVLLGVLIYLVAMGLYIGSRMAPTTFRT